MWENNNSDIKPSRLKPYERVLLFSGIPLLTVQLFAVYQENSLSLIDIGILVVLGVLLATVIASILRNGSQFQRALFERARFLYGLLFSLLLWTLNITRMVIFGMLRSLIWLIILLAYLISPVDFIPDFLFPLGILDDVGFTILFIKFINFQLSEELSSKAQDIIEETQIQTPFP